MDWVGSSGLVLRSVASYLVSPCSPAAPCSEFAMNLMASLPEIAYDDAEDEEELAAANGGDGDGSVTLQVCVYGGRIKAEIRDVLCLCYQGSGPIV